MFVPTDELQLVHARAERWDAILSLVATLNDADGWLSADEIASRTDMRMKFALGLAVEQTGTWVCRRETVQGGYEFATTGGWVVDGYVSDHLHPDPECPHLRDFAHRPATDEECEIVERCAECGDGDNRADEQDWSAYQAAREAADD